MDSKLSLRAADNIRILCAAMVEKAKSGHPGGSMGGADFIHVLYSEFLNYDPSDMRWFCRDRFFLDPGHMSPMLYSMLTLMGHYTLDELKNFRQWGSPTPGHPELDITRGVENTSGPLGQGHTMALGAAIAERFLVARMGEAIAHKTYTYISDGGIQEEISQGTGRIAGHLGLANLIMFYDSNSIQLSHATSETTSEDTAKKYEAWGWRVETIDGNNHDQIRAALKRANSEKERPTIIIGKTVMGKGACTAEKTSFEGKCSTHGQPLSKSGASFEETIKGLCGDPANPFVIFSDVAQEYEAIRLRKIEQADTRKHIIEDWEKANPQLAQKLRCFREGSAPKIDFSAIQQKPGSASRNASGTVLSTLAKQVENMIVASADLSDSDKTEGFLKNTKAFKKGDFSGAFLQAGVCELTMASICNGMALHGGVVAACGTFFVFSDYMKPAVRLACLMGLPVKYIWTHDAFRVGEDGPTHEPIEQEAQIRLMEKISWEGHRSMVVLRPGDTAETTVAWKIALENLHTPTALILSRQDLPDLPAKSGNRYSEALQAHKGAYTVVEIAGKPDLVLVANGSEVSLCVEAAKNLSVAKNMKIAVVSAISEGIFRDQTPEYQQKVIPFGVPVFGVTAGLPVTLQGMVGPLGKVFGMERFGASAPYTVLDEKFGYKTANIVVQIEKYLGEFDGMMKMLKE